MKHWDLKPGEDVTLVSDDGRTLYGFFEFRDTIRAAFMIENDQGELKFCTFRLTDHGDLRSGQFGGHYRRQLWMIKGAERNTRISIKEPRLQRVQAAGGEA